MTVNQKISEQKKNLIWLLFIKIPLRMVSHHRKETALMELLQKWTTNQNMRIKSLVKK